MLIPLHLLQGDAQSPVQGTYLEARTAAIFAGACHANGERMLEGREALCVWHFESGPSAGVTVALLVVGDANLAEEQVRWNSRCFISDQASSAARESAIAWLRQREPRWFSTELEPHALRIETQLAGDHYSVQAQGRFALEGSALVDRACCKMPLQVWYQPLAQVENRIVGDNTRFFIHEEALDRHFERPGENSTFIARFR